MNEQQWEEVKIEDVQPGDVARCNGREFPIGECPLMGASPLEWVCFFSETSFYSIGWFGWKRLGFTFWRKVKRQPRTWEATVFARDGRHDLLMLRWHHDKAGPQEETRVRVTEILDGEDGT